MNELLSVILPLAVIFSGFVWAAIRGHRAERESAVSDHPQVDECRPDPADTAKFSAWTTCPKCAATDFHLIRDPIANNHNPESPSPADESAFGAIRLCTNCEHEWGQK